MGPATGPAAGEPGDGIAPNLALDEAVARRIAAGESILHLGFGESRLPVFDGLAAALAAGAGRNAYGPVAGDAATREAVAGYFRRRALPTEAAQVVVAPGSKALILATLAAIGGDVVLSRPAWVTYAPQVRLAGGRPVWVDIPERCGGVPDPEALPAALAGARAAGLRPASMILTAPDNPTGTTAPPEIVRHLVDIAVEHDLAIISDEIYRDVIFDPGDPYLSPAEVAPDRTVVATGLSKSLSLGGWRIGVARYPAGAWGDAVRDRVVALASQSWSSLAGPQQEVTRYAFEEPSDLVAYRSACTALHGTVAREVHRLFAARDIACRPPTGGFYLYPDLGFRRHALKAEGVVGSAGIEAHLLEHLGVAVLGGHHFGDDPEGLRFRVATSMLYGDTPAEQRAALASPDPLAEPGVAGRLRTLAERLDRLAG